jgi:acetylornithine deacetylase/succinyl-diaminopimelate desuccinylase-like protein
MMVFPLALAILGCAAAGPERAVPGPAAEQPDTALASRAAEILARAIRYRTVNPPGDEAPLAAYFVGLLRAAGVDARVVPTPTGESPAGRAAAWARFPGRGRRPPVVLLSHLDVVSADEGAWRLDPFAGAVQDGYVHGRGAQDAKGVAVVHLLALAELARRARPLERDVIFLATPDEESGGLDGAGWLLRRHPELLGGAGYVLTEGGGVLVDPGDREAWHVAITEKSPCWLRLVVDGPPGHSSVPPRDAAVPRLVAALERIRTLETEVRVVPEVARMFAALAPLATSADALPFESLDTSLASDPEFRERFLGQPHYASLVRDTLSVTVLSGSTRTNVLAARAEAEIDARLLPGASCASFTGDLERLVADTGVRVETLLSFRSRSSPVDTPLYRAIQSVAAAESPQAVVIPRVLAGFTDAHFFREIGIVAYGFVPRWHRAGELRGVHGPNERISVQNLERGVAMLLRILEELDRQD